MQYIVLFLAGLADQILKWILGTGIKAAAMTLTYTALILGLFTAFLALIWATLNIISVAAPYQMGFILSLVPTSVSVYTSAYLTVLISKRVFDWHKQIIAAQVSASWKNAY